MVLYQSYQLYWTTADPSSCIFFNCSVNFMNTHLCCEKRTPNQHCSRYIQQNQFAYYGLFLLYLRCRIWAGEEERAIRTLCSSGPSEPSGPSERLVTGVTVHGDESLWRGALDHRGNHLGHPVAHGDQSRHQTSPLLRLGQGPEHTELTQHQHHDCQSKDCSCRDC